MERFRVIPVLLLHRGGLVKSVRFGNYKYVGDPINAVKIFNEKEIDEIVILDIDASREKRGPNFEQIRSITSEAFIPVAYGGGITSIEQIKRLFFDGVEKIVLNYSAVQNPSLISEAAKMVGSQSVVISVDFKKRMLGGKRVMTLNGKINVKDSIVEFCRKMEILGAGEIFLNSIDRDGTYKGYDLEILREVSSVLSIPVVICGGASELSDFYFARKNGASAVAAGSMFVFQRPHQAVLISYPSQGELKEKVFK
jgi:cyclase